MAAQFVLPQSRPSSLFCLIRKLAPRGPNKTLFRSPFHSRGEGHEKKPDSSPDLTSYVSYVQRNPARSVSQKKKTQKRVSSHSERAPHLSTFGRNVFRATPLDQPASRPTPNPHSAALASAESAADGGGGSGTMCHFRIPAPSSCLSPPPPLPRVLSCWLLFFMLGGSNRQ